MWLTVNGIFKVSLVLSRLSFSVQTTLLSSSYSQHLLFKKLLILCMNYSGSFSWRYSDGKTDYYHCMEVSLSPTSPGLARPDKTLKYPNCRSSGQEERGEVRVLSGPLPGHHLHHQDQAEDSLLLLQSDRPLHPHRQHGCARLHPPPGLRGETVPR